MHQHISNNIKSQKKKLFISIILNVLITISQLIGGVISNSLALISDAMHNFSDVIALIISYIANSLKNSKKPNGKYTFGYKRAEIIAAFINSATLIIISVSIFNYGYEKLMNKQNVISNYNIVIILAILSILFNAISALLLFKGSKNNLNIRSLFLHLFSDMLTSVGVLITGILTKYYENLYWLDSVMSFIIVIYLLYNSIPILLKTLEILMQFTPRGINAEQIVKRLKKIEGVEDIFHVHIWRLDDEEIHFEAKVIYIENISLKKAIEIQTQIEKTLLTNYKINHTTLQPEEVNDESESNKIFKG